MARRLRVRQAVAAGLAVLALTAGCGGVTDDRLPPADDPVAWAGRVCAAMQPLSSRVGPTLDPNNPATSRDTVIGYFADVERQAGEALTGLEQVGPSPIAGGDEVAAKLRGALERLRAAYADARTQMEAIDPSDPVALGSRLPRILAALAATAADKDLTGRGQNRELNDAVRRAPSCALIPATHAAPN